MLAARGFSLVGFGVNRFGSGSDGKVIEIAE